MKKPRQVEVICQSHTAGEELRDSGYKTHLVNQPRNSGCSCEGLRKRTGKMDFPGRRELATSASLPCTSPFLPPGGLSSVRTSCPGQSQNPKSPKLPVMYTYPLLLHLPSFGNVEIPFVSKEKQLRILLQPCSLWLWARDPSKVDRPCCHRTHCTWPPKHLPDSLSSWSP